MKLYEALDPTSGAGVEPWALGILGKQSDTDPSGIFIKH